MTQVYTPEQRERNRARARAYYAKNIEKIRPHKQEAQRRSRSLHADRVKEQAHGSYLRNIEKRREYSKNYEATKRQRAQNAGYNKRSRANRLKWPQVILRDIRHRCVKTGTQVDLSPDDLIIPDNCPVLGIPLIYGGGRNNPNSPSVDRRIPALGYVKGNVQVISLRANKLKSDCIDPEELRKVADYVESCQVNDNV